MSAGDQMKIMLAKIELQTKLAAQKKAGDIDSDEEEQKTKEIERLSKKAVRDAKDQARDAGHGRAAPRLAEQRALKLKEKSYTILVGTYPTPKTARQMLEKALQGWITSQSGLRGCNGYISHHGTKDMFFYVRAASTTTVATVHMSDDSNDTSFKLPEEGQGQPRPGMR